jgi:hypothetical protein
MSQGLDLTFAYTWSKSIDDTRQFSSGVGQQNYYDRWNERSIGAVDQPHIVTFSYVYELPFGVGKRFASSTGSVTTKIVGGWSVSGVHSYKSGTPLSLSVTNALPIFIVLHKYPWLAVLIWLFLMPLLYLAGAGLKTSGGH